MARMFLIGAGLVLFALSSTAQQPAATSESQQTPAPSQPAASGSSLGDFARQQRAKNSGVAPGPATSGQATAQSQKSMAEIAAERRTRKTGQDKKSSKKTRKSFSSR